MTDTSGVTGGHIQVLQQTNNFSTPGGVATYTISNPNSATGTTITLGYPNIAPNVGGTIAGSVYNQAKYTHGFIKTMAPVINSAFAFGYAGVDGTSSIPARYIYGVTAKTSACSIVSGTTTCPPVQTDTYGTVCGIDMMTKYYTGGTYSTAGYNINADTISSWFYIFATTNCPETQDPSTINGVVFTVANGSSVTVINESRTIPISGGKFTDSAFGNAWAVHIYKVNP
jgi:hypothetical protein